LKPVVFFKQYLYHAAAQKKRKAVKRRMIIEDVT
jgi:ectoine hydroxylase-related dioxygenase (phytanoyl-CoA dioxygenase family)